ncbi:hypothetical protein GCM10010331_77330 [Streptomyces xanthochromogenes]|nr:hypothetical protein GCM10010331_77330 [Streptomyces xanthochromogenes]
MRCGQNEGDAPFTIGTPAENGRQCKRCGAAPSIPADDRPAADQSAAARRTFEGHGEEHRSVPPRQQSANPPY